MVRTRAVENTEPVAAFAHSTASIVHVAWDFDDGSYQAGGPSADAVYVHTYTAAGTYTVPCTSSMTMAA